MLMLLMNALDHLLYLETGTSCLDESKIKSFKKNLQGKIKIIGKPYPIGNKINNIADGYSKIVVKVALHEGMGKMQENE